MRNVLRILAAFLALQPVLAVAQSQVPLPYHTVWGRLGAQPGDTGPGQAIPFATLLASMGGAPTSRLISTTAPLTGGGDLSVNRTLSIAANGIDNTLIRQSGALSLVGRSANSTGNIADISAVAASSCAFIESGSTIICGQLATAGIANNAVDNTKIRQSGALSLVGRSANSTGNVADISAVAASSCVFLENASSLQCGQVATAGLANNAVTNAKMATMANATFKCRTTAGTGNPEDCTATQSTALLNAMVGDSGSGGTKGLVPAPGSGDAALGKYLKADGTYAVPPGGSGLPATTKAAQQTGTDNTTAATPLHQQDHDSAIKGWVNFTANGCSGTCTIQASYNVTSVTRSSAGIYAVTFTTAFANTNYGCHVTAEQTGVGGIVGWVNGGTRATGSVGIAMVTPNTAASTDPTSVFVECVGRQ